MHEMCMEYVANAAEIPYYVVRVVLTVMPGGPKQESTRGCVLYTGSRAVLHKVNCGRSIDGATGTNYRRRNNCELGIFVAD